MKFLLAYISLFLVTPVLAANQIVIDHGTFRGHPTETIMTFGPGHVLEKQVFLVQGAPQYDHSIQRQPDGTYKQVTTFVGWGF